jgi:hypothetical protein
VRGVCAIGAWHPRTPKLPEDGNLAGCRAAGSLGAMTGRRVLSLLVGLWALAAGAQATVTATASLPLDGGIGFARAYVVTAGGTNEYAMANAGEAIQVFAVGTNAEQTPLKGQFATFAVADNIVVGGLPTTLVVAADVGPLCPTVCLDIFFWDPVNGFVKQAVAPTNVSGPTAMTIDATASAGGGPIQVYFVAAPTTLYRQQLALTTNSVTVVGIPFGIPTAGTSAVQGLTVDGAQGLLYASDNASNIYIYPEDGGAGSPYSTPSNGGYISALGLFYYPFPLIPPPQGAPYLLAGGVAGGVYALSPDTATGSIVIGSVQVLTADGGRITQPTSASLDALAMTTLLTEDNVTAEVPTGPWLHLILGINLFPDGGAPSGGDAGVDAGGIPTIPIIAPGPGALPGTTNSCNCSTAGSAPVLLALLLPLLIPRRRR